MVNREKTWARKPPGLEKRRASLSGNSEEDLGRWNWGVPNEVRLGLVPEPESCETR